jgi:uncharacterized repeat protein (TIGR01451 family)
MTITKGFAQDDSKGCRMLKLSWTLTLLGLLTFLLPAVANAVPLTYNLSGVTFSDGGTASGSFQYDAVTNAYSNVNIMTAGGSRSGATYHSVSGGFAPDSSGILLVTMAGAGQTGLPGLALFFSPVLNGAGGMSTLTGEEADCVDPECTMPSGTMRTITAGTVSAGAAATPKTWYLRNFTFADGATATGSFVFDASTHSFSSVNIATTTATRTGATYNTLSTGLNPDATGALFDTSASPNQTGLPGVSMLFSSPLTGAGGTSSVTGQEADCTDPGCSTPTGTMRLITAGIVTTNPADMTITKTHVGNFRQGDISDTYTLTVTNSGGIASSGMVSVSDTVPSGLTAIGIGGSNWSCVQPAGPCTRSDALAAGGSYEPLTMTVNVAGNAPSSVINIATVSGGLEVNTSNDTANDPTTINPAPDLTISKTHVGNFNQGQTGATYTITVSNSGSGPTSGAVSVSDTVPSGLTATAISGTNWNCTQPAGPCTRSDAKAAGGSYEPITLTVNVAGNAPSSVTNIATVSGGLEANTSNDTANDPTTINNSPGGIINFSASNYAVSESANFVTLTANRTGNTSGAATVDYATSDDSGPGSGPCVNGVASSRCDFTSAFGTLKFAPGDTQKTFVVLITQDTYTSVPLLSFNVTLSNLTGGAVFGTPSSATVTVTDAANSLPPNAIDDTTLFVRQQYHDFLNREPDASGLAFWKNNIDQCNDPANRAPGQSLAQCLDVQRINTSAAFFLSIEFQNSGMLVRNFYVAALNRPATNNMPAFVEFERDAQAVARGVIVDPNNNAWQAVLNANRTAFMNDFVMRAEFVGLYPTTDTPTQYVDKLYLHAGITPSASERSNAIAEFGGAGTAADPAARGRALLDVTQNATFQSAQMNKAFVQMQYLGYLRRNPNDAPDSDFTGYNFWLNKLNAFNGNFVQAEMVKAFISSSEYRRRFGP